MGQYLNIAMVGISLKVLMRMLTFSDLNECCLAPVPTMPPYRDHHDLDPAPKWVIKGQPSNIAMFGIKSKVLMSTSTIDC